MSRQKVDEIEDYLLGRIAALEALLLRYADEKHTLAGFRSQLVEARTTLKKVKEIAGRKR